MPTNLKAPAFCFFVSKTTLFLSNILIINTDYRSITQKN